jgi:glutamyl-tRNA reductase
MERIAVVGLSLHETDVAGLERLARPPESERDAFARDLADALAASELVYLATCNRIEVAFAREIGHLPGRGDVDAIAAQMQLAPSDALRERLHFWSGREAVRHLFRVAASLDSVVVGEDQILAQVREAFARSEHIGLSGRLLGTLFEHAFQVGKLVRTDTDLSRHPVSVVSLGVAAIARRFENARPRLALLGAGQMAELFARSARDHGLAVDVVVNRSLARAQKLAETCGARAQTLEQFARSRESFDALAAATSAPGFVVERELLLDLARRTPLGRPLVAVDLAVPRDIEPVSDPRVEIVDLDRLRGLADENRNLRAAAAARAEALVEQRLEVFARKFTRQALDAALAELQSESSSVFEREMAQLFTGRLAQLDDEERRAVERWARTAFGRVSHVPLSAIKRMASDAALFGGHSSEQDV